MKKESSKTNIELRELLNQTVRLRLFCNTNDELGQYIGYNLTSNNSINTIQPFAARCIFRELNRETYELLDETLDLEDILDWYKTASEFYCRYIRGRDKVLQKENIHVLLKCAYIKDYQLPDNKRFLRDIANRMPNRGGDVPVLILLMLGVLPLYTSKRGDVKNIMADFKEMYVFLRDFIECDEALYRLPVLDRFEKAVRERIRCNRAYLIYVASTVLETYRSFSNSSNLYELNAEVAKSKVLFDLGDCFWVEPTMLSAPTVFWRFEQVATDDYFLYRYVVNTEKKQTLYVRYEAVFSDDNKQGLTLFVEHPDSTTAFLKRQHLFKDSTFLFACELDDWDAPTVIELQSILDVNRTFPAQKIIRLQDEDMAAQLQKCIDGETFKLINQYPESEYDLWIVPVAITSEYIYFCTETNFDPEGQNSYYRVPKSLNEGLLFITSNDRVGILEHNGRKYLGFVNLILYFDVTDKEACQNYGIEVVRKIVI
ncbi:hypothetical protein [Bacteroides sp. 224]|uniref:hypothetical protein n=1 Tax=Bacteroides sp. 224 TaxID=2302936 RepID=UPI0013D05183|nr:hypothetical protein [Bacteroides sp. 224]